MIEVLILVLDGLDFQHCMKIYCNCIRIER